MPYLLILLGCFGITISIIGLYIPFIQQLDTSIVAWVSQYRNPFFDGIAVFLSYVGGLPAMLLFVGIWAIQQWRLKQNLTSLFILLGLIGGSAIGWLLKFTFNRPRPDAIYQMVQTYGAAFPSAHSLYAAVLFVLVILIGRNQYYSNKMMILAMIWCVGMGFSRVYLGAHYPTDVISGWSIAFLWVAVLWLLLSKQITKQRIIFREKSYEVE